MKPAVTIDHLYKKYKLGSRQNYETLRDSFSSMLVNPLGLVSKFRSDDKLGVNEFWALENLSLKVDTGEVLGIIGPNGSGKSTLLKILSRITPPTRGRIEIRGKISSLLEVGTGFHQELTGRENVYLNGAILGMHRREVKSKFDEIVEFSGIEKFIDTPIKRYSSGMVVRLAFSVAAFLDTDILLVDEVLGVGDAQFQNKCLSKMGEITSKEGKTVLYVSHNMGSVKALCDRAIYLKKGKIVSAGIPDKVISDYYSSAVGQEDLKSAFGGKLSDEITINSIKLNRSSNRIVTVDPDDTLHFEVSGNAKRDIGQFRFTFSVFSDEVRLFSVHDVAGYSTRLKMGKFKVSLRIKKNILRPGRYHFAFGGHTLGSADYLWGRDLLTFIVSDAWDDKNEQINLGLINLHDYETSREN